MTKLYWIQSPYKCPVCDNQFIKISEQQVVLNGNRKATLPAWKCLSCGNSFLKYMSLDLVEQCDNATKKYLETLDTCEIEEFDKISCKYLISDNPVIAEHKEKEKTEEAIALAKKREAFQARKAAISQRLNLSDDIENIENIGTDDNSLSDSEDSIYKKATDIIKKLYGEDASFREGQFEAIKATLENKRTLVVQKTGWGKSLVYFVVSKILSEQKKGVTVVVSPLLALMDNQMNAAKKLGIKCGALNSQTIDRPAVIDDLINGRLDMVFVTPETLFSKDVQNEIPNIKIGLFVIDEAHCISDWGHDFRLEYCRLRDVLGILDKDVPLLATTATANDSVVRDLTQQFGGKVHVSRGKLMRNNLAIQVLRLPDKAARYAWLVENIPKLEGTGIIYCLTQKDCENLSNFLNHYGINALPYYSRDGEGEQQNQIALQKFINNEIKVLVSTVKLGMGFDKGDVAFVVHFQMPANVVTYYQQIGRAGRNIPKAYTFLMAGKEDVDIHDYFIRKAFPEEHEMRDVLAVIRECTEGATTGNIFSQLNISSSRLDKTLAFLLNDGYIFKDRSKYFAIGREFHYEAKHYNSIREMRKDEINQMFELLNTKECYNRHIINLLNDNTQEKCGCCSNCMGEILPKEPSFESKLKAKEYIDGITLEIIPRKRWPRTAENVQGNIPVINQVGICLSRYGDAGYGELVREGKYSESGIFPEALVIRGKEVLLKDVIQYNQVKYITCVPSLRSDIVKDYAIRLAERTGTTFVELLEKKPADQQKHQENSIFQFLNAKHSFAIKQGVTVPKKIILVDDIVDSKWTLTVCGNILCENGCEWVFPFVLAESSKRDDM